MLGNICKIILVVILLILMFIFTIAEKKEFFDEAFFIISGMFVSMVAVAYFIIYWIVNKLKKK